MRGGGTVFGPQPRDYSYKLPKKVKWLALSSALTAKLNDGEVMVVDSLSVAEPKTKLVKGMLDGLGLTKNVLMIVPEKDAALELAVRNIPKVHVARVGELNAASIIKHEKLLIAKDAIKRMEEAYLG
jgi:large subunit ribosomal protein L4